MARLGRPWARQRRWPGGGLRSLGSTAPGTAQRPRRRLGIESRSSGTALYGRCLLGHRSILCSIRPSGRHLAFADKNLESSVRMIACATAHSTVPRVRSRGSTGARTAAALPMRCRQGLPRFVSASCDVEVPPSVRSDVCLDEARIMQRDHDLRPQQATGGRPEARNRPR